MATEAAWLNGNNFKKETTKRGKNKRKGLTLTGLLMEGVESVSRTTTATLRSNSERPANNTFIQATAQSGPASGLLLDSAA